MRSLVYAFDDRGFRQSPKSIWIRARKVELSYATRLRRIAKHVGDIVREFPEGTVEASVAIRAALERYSVLIEPWAEAVGSRMVAEVAQRDRAAWMKASEQIGRTLRREIDTAPTGVAMRQLLAEQVGLIKSIPLDAAQRVHEQTLEGILKGERPDVIAKRILETENVTKSRATLIARTETARTSSVLTQVRAQHAGSTHYIWRTAGDGDVRPSHKKLNGRTFAWDNPPECDPGHRAHPGQIWNCRCFAEPVFAE